MPILTIILAVLFRRKNGVTMISSRAEYTVADSWGIRVDDPRPTSTTSKVKSMTLIVLGWI